jgi:hypothetical protein
MRDADDAEVMKNSVFLYLKIHFSKQTLPCRFSNYATHNSLILIKKTYGKG